MNGLSVNELCCLFCCPPCPSHIVAKLAFLPPQPTYKFITSATQKDNQQNNEQASLSPNSKSDPAASAAAQANLDRNGSVGSWMQLLRQSSRRLCSTIVCSSKAQQQQQQQYSWQHTNAKIFMLEKAEWQYGPVELEKLEVFYTRTKLGNQIACLHVRCTPTPRYTILFSHGNAVDLGQMSSFYYGLGSRLECNIFTYDYSGYGASEGRPSENNLYADIEAAWNALRSKYGISPSNIVLYGQSIGKINLFFILLYDLGEY
jgi:hypothetical protein